MSPTRYILFCAASNEWFTFADLQELGDYVNPSPHHPHYYDHHDDVTIFQVTGEMKLIPREEVEFPMVKSWILRESK